MTDEGKPLDDPDRFVRAGIWFYGAMAILAVLWRVGAYGESIWVPTRFDDPAPPAPWPWLHSVAAGGAIAAFAISASWWATERTGWGRALSNRLASLLPRIGVADAILLSAASGLAEEMFFRGALQPRSGLLVASVLFGLLHLPGERALWPWTAFALAMGFGLGWLFEASGSLIGPIVAHTLINAVNLPLLLRRARLESQSEAEPPADSDAGGGGDGDAGAG